VTGELFTKREDQEDLRKVGYRFENTGKKEHPEEGADPGKKGVQTLQIIRKKPKRPYYAWRKSQTASHGLSSRREKENKGGVLDGIRNKGGTLVTKACDSTDVLNKPAGRGFPVKTGRGLGGCKPG